MPSSVARLTGLDHERLSRLLRRMCSEGPNQERWRAEFTGLLRAHRIAERDTLLHEVVQHHPHVAEPVSRLAAGDVRLDELTLSVEGADPRSIEFEGLCNEFQQVLADHSHLLSREVLDRLEPTIGRKEMRRLGGMYETVRDERLRDAGVLDPPPRRLDLSRAELYELARRAGVEGRSSMSRDELITELQRRQQH